jgi:transcriptional regulator with XRE-family HTH domain
MTTYIKPHGHMTKKEFKRLRKSIGYTQARLADEMGLFIRTVSRWETGEVVIPRVAELALMYIVDNSKKKEKK